MNDQPAHLREHDIPLACAVWLDGEAGRELRAEVTLPGNAFCVRVGSQEWVAQGSASLERVLREALPETPVGEAARALLLAQVAANMGPWT